MAELTLTVCEVCGQAPVACWTRDVVKTGVVVNADGREWDRFEPGDLHAYCREHAPEEAPVA